MCTTHYIRYDTLYDVLLNDIKSKLKVIYKDEEAFVKKVLKKLGSTSNQKFERAKKEMESTETRLKELEVKFDRLYDDRLEGYISDKKFKEMAAKCEAEQEQLNIRLDELKEQFGQQTEIEINVSRFIETVSKYTEVESLDREILNRLINKVVVGDRIKTDSGYTQKLKIYYRFLGDFCDDCIAK